MDAKLTGAQCADCVDECPLPSYQMDNNVLHASHTTDIQTCWGWQWGSWAAAMMNAAIHTINSYHWSQHCPNQTRQWIMVYICFASAESPVWRRGKASGLYAGEYLCNACGTQDKRHGLRMGDLHQKVHGHTLCVTQSAAISQYMHCSAFVSSARYLPDVASSWLMQPCRFVAVKIMLTTTHSDFKLANLLVLLYMLASTLTPSIFVAIIMTVSALCPQVDNADAMASGEQEVQGADRRRVKVNRRARGRAVAVTREGREPQMDLVSISTAWQVNIYGIGNSFWFIA